MDEDSKHHEKEDGFSRDDPHPPGVGAAWGAALEEPRPWARKAGRSRAGPTAGHPFLSKARGASEA